MPPATENPSGANCISPRVKNLLRQNISIPSFNYTDSFIEFYLELCFIRRDLRCLFSHGFEAIRISNAMLIFLFPHSIIHIRQTLCVILLYA